MRFKKQIKEDVIKILNKNNVQVAKYIQNVEHMFNSCDNDDWTSCSGVDGLQPTICFQGPQGTGKPLP